ncbi:GAF domain-containing protein [Quadrisphaera sp. INWT6]|uniref:GAF domain-containing protein n=1 Tax=Quadrisphaera sp. INWT6 TaxID=2596917 RepID=UPI0018927689|nr:GAF domain-containing protein [Quadrisphaera sp. INWT6]
MTTLEGAGSALGSFSDPSPAALLRAVHDSATDLASVRDRAVILRALVRRTRALLGADMAYLSLNDLDAGETWIHVTDGVRTRAYAQIRMPLGTGILGSVAAGGTSVHTDDYLADADLNHLTHIDEAVAAEGVRAISGEPLRVDGHLVGALLVAHRTPVEMPPAGLEALRLLALQAAVALEQTRRAIEIATLRTRADAVSAAAARDAALLALDARLLAALRDGGGCHAVVEELAAELGAPVVLLGADGTQRCGSPPRSGRAGGQRGPRNGDAPRRRGLRR